MRRLSRLAVPLFAAGLFAALPPPAFAQHDDPHAAAAPPHAPGAMHADPAMLTVSGRGTVSVKPDRATVRLGASAQKPEAGAAQAEVNRLMQATIDEIKKLGIADDVITTSGISLYPVYDQRPRRDDDGGEPRVIAFRASNTVSVQLDDISKVGAVIDGGVKAGANQLEGVSFELKDDGPQRREALQRAVRDARAKADAIAGALDSALDGVQDASEGGISLVTPMFKGRSMEMMDADAGGGGAPIQPGQVRVEATVTIRYRLAAAHK